MTAAGEDDGLPGPDVHCLPPLVDVAVLPKALQELSGLRVLPRRVVGRDPQNFASEGFLTNDLVETAMKA